MNKTQVKLWFKAKRAGFFLQSTPFLRMIGVNGSLAREKATAKSDIDFLIVAEENRIWTCRFFVVLITFFLRMKRTNKKIAQRICLNRFITTNSLVIFPYDKYHAEVYSQTIPVFDKKIYRQFIQANVWMNNYISLKEKKPMLIKNSFFLSAISLFLEYILSGQLGNFLENFLKKIQLKKIQNNPFTLKKEGLILVNDSMLCFHPTSQTTLTKVG